LFWIELQDWHFHVSENLCICIYVSNAHCEIWLTLQSQPQ
jgi:hypothetical protein